MFYFGKPLNESLQQESPLKLTEETIYGLFGTLKKPFKESLGGPILESWKYKHFQWDAS